MRIRKLLGCTLLFAAACSGPESLDSDGNGLVTCEEEADSHCDHLIDRLIVPKLRQKHIAVRDGDASSICRRMAIDLVGRIPTESELATCTGQSTNAERAETFMAMPDYVLVQTRSWAETLGFNGYLLWYGAAVDLDAYAARLFAEGDDAIDYPTFAAKIAQHPAFYGLHQGDDWAANIFSTFLGRAARPDEMAGMRPLTKLFESRVFCDAALWRKYYADAIADNRSPSDAGTDANGRCVDLGTEEYAYNFCGCVRGEGSIGCRSTTLGTLVELGQGGCSNPQAEDETSHFYRVPQEIVAGGRTSCGGAPCQDKIVDEEEHVGGALRPLPLIDGAGQARIDKLGAALVLRPDFWEAGADRELGRLIGWWKDGVRRPDFDLPEVRTALANELKRTGSLRAIQKLIVTSLLYTTPTEPPPDFHASPNPTGPGMTKAPLWSMGSTKLLASESWLDSAAIATFGEPLGYCDYRFVALGETGPTMADPALIKVRKPPEGASFAADRYSLSSVLLGGCSAEQPRPKKSTVGITYAQHDLARSLCATSTLVGDEKLETAVKHLVLRTLSRDATREEVKTLADEARACIDAEGACRDEQAAVRWLCTRIIDSAAFALY